MALWQSEGQIFFAEVRAPRGVSVARRAGALAAAGPVEFSFADAVPDCPSVFLATLMYQRAMGPRRDLGAAER